MKRSAVMLWSKVFGVEILQHCPLENYHTDCDAVPLSSSSLRSPLHSERKTLAPVRLPSPPHTHRLEMPRLTRLKAADKRPSRVVKALQRALPITVPPWVNNTCTAADHALVIRDYCNASARGEGSASHTCIRVEHSKEEYRHSIYRHHKGFDNSRVI